jgi:hypothetical protein
MIKIEDLKWKESSYILGFIVLLGLGVFLTFLKEYPLAFFCVTLGFAILSVGLAFKAIDIAKESDKRIKYLEKKEIHRKLLMFQEENKSNIDLIEKLIKRKDKFYPPDLLGKKLKQNREEKYNYTDEEWEIIKKGGLWIHKDNFSYDYALRVLEIGHYFNPSFITEIRRYIEIGKHLNAQKDFCQQWLVSRGTANPDETHSYYNALDKAKKVTTKMKELLEKSLKAQPKEK